jgi:hypothetical protein
MRGAVWLAFKEWQVSYLCLHPFLSVTMLVSTGGDELAVHGAQVVTC